jgi:hypothetical protein
MTAMEVRANYVYYIGAGAVTMAGPHLARRLAADDLRRARRRASGAGARPRPARRRERRRGQARPTRRPPRARPARSASSAGRRARARGGDGAPAADRHQRVGALLALFFAFLFVTVSSRITGQIGSSANPISGMTVATVLLTALIFLAVGWTGVEHRVLALSIGGVVCVAAAVAGATSQDLKTGHLVGATPARQQIGLLAGVTTSALLIGFTIQALDRAATTYAPRAYAGVAVRDVEPTRYNIVGDRLAEAPAGALRVGHLYEQTGPAPAGRYLVDGSGAIRYLVDPGIGGSETRTLTGREVTKLDSPKAQIMRLVVDGILTQKLSWGLILVGAFFTVALEILGLSSLPVAVGLYLPISTSAGIFAGGAVRWLAERAAQRARRGGRRGADRRRVGERAGRAAVVGADRRRGDHGDRARGAGGVRPDGRDRPGGARWGAGREPGGGVPDLRRGDPGAAVPDGAACRSFLMRIAGRFADRGRASARRSRRAPREFRPP